MKCYTYEPNRSWMVRRFMLFNSYVFVLLFLPLCISGYFLLNHFKRYRQGQVFLLFMSLWFYGYFTPAYLPIILLSIVLNYGFSYVLLKNERQIIQKGTLAAALLANVGILFYYKYFDFFKANVNMLFGTSFAASNVLLPLGISFFTFQQLSYVIDSYRKEVPVYNFIEYACFVTYFPQLIAGPIVTHDELVPQFMDEKRKHFCWTNFASGVYVFVLGMAKKVLIADVFGNAVNWGFANIGKLDSSNALITMLSYTVQIYFDFSGYCDMAIGIGKMMNIELPMNFNSPYQAVNIAEFWNRWHMTLTRFFRKYVYIPLGVNRNGKLRTYRNVMIVYLISGLWHGANWTFLLWGALHGTASVIYRGFRRYIDRVPRVLNWLLTFTFINVAWVFFRADSIGDACALLSRIAQCNFGGALPEITNAFASSELTFLLHLVPGIEVLTVCPQFLLIGYFAVVCAILFFSRNAFEKMNTFEPTLLTLTYTVILAVWCIMSFAGVSTFLYFNF